MKKIICLLFISIFGITALCANPNFIGSWTATVEYNHSIDTYKIILSDNGRCTVKVSNNNAEQETNGNWSYDGTFFRLNAIFRNAKLSYLSSIQWASVVNFFPDGNSFHIQDRISTNGTRARITFFKTDDSLEVTYNEKAIPQIFNSFSQNIPQRSRLAIVGITAADPSNPNSLAEAAFYVNELTMQFVNSRRYTVVDRNDIDKVLTEQNFQMSGYVDDNAFVTIGKFIGANVVITGSITGTGSQKRLIIKAIDVLTSEILSMQSVSLL
ncbi:MAG: CsgG/HfaB family protein [Treponema sp.]|nr:CsgG/HfaB family protein [Treponema sp.]